MLKWKSSQAKLSRSHADDAPESEVKLKRNLGTDRSNEYIGANRLYRCFPKAWLTLATEAETETEATVSVSVRTDTTEAKTEASLSFILTTFSFAFICLYIASPSAKKAQASSTLKKENRLG